MPLERIDDSSIVCGCTFRERLRGEVQGGYGSGPDILVMAPNASPPYALANVGGGNLRLLPSKPIEFPMYQCDVGESFESEWKNSEVAVIARLRVAGAGSEACWFSGDIHASTARGRTEIPVKGACGC
jgi:hypothetical protein